MNYRLTIGAAFSLFNIISCAQAKYGIKKVDAFFRENQPGNIRMDEQHNPINSGPDTVYSIYLETKDVAIKWVGAWKNGKPYSIVSTAIDETPYQVGVDKLSNQNVILEPVAGNKLWQLQLEPTENKSKPPVKTTTDEIIIKGKAGKKTIIQRIYSQVELTTIPSV